MVVPVASLCCLGSPICGIGYLKDDGTRHFPWDIIGCHMIMQTSLCGSHKPLIGARNHKPLTNARDHKPLTNAIDHKPLTGARNHIPLNNARDHKPLIGARDHNPLTDAKHHRPLTDGSERRPLTYGRDDKVFKDSYTDAKNDDILMSRTCDHDNIITNDIEYHQQKAECAVCTLMAVLLV
jgi:hypothetical protein